MTKKFRNHDERVEMSSTDHPLVTCTKLPEFWRANKKFSTPFTVQFADMSLAPEGTRVTITAANHKNQNPEIRNNQSVVVNGMARFNDLRFVGKSGRDTKFDVYIHVQTEPMRLFTYKNAIKVTVDGPRPPRLKNEKMPGDEASPVHPHPQKRKPGFEFSAFEEYANKKPRHQEQMYANFPFSFLPNMPPSCSMPNSPEPSESSAHSPYNNSVFNMPPSPISVVSCSHSERRNQSTSPSSSSSSSSSSSISALSPKMLPLRKRLSHLSEEQAPHNDLSDLIDTRELLRQLNTSGHHHFTASSSPSSSSAGGEELMSIHALHQQAEQIEQISLNASNYYQNNLLPQNQNDACRSGSLDIASMLSAMAPENHLYFLALLNFYCSSGGQDLLTTMGQQAPSSLLRGPPFVIN